MNRLGVTSAIGIYLVTGKMRIVEATLASTAAEALRDFTFAVIPLFMLMGELIGRSGAVTDVYKAINRSLRRIPGRLAVATVLVTISVILLTVLELLRRRSEKLRGLSPG